MSLSSCIPAGVKLAFCPGEGPRDNSCSSRGGGATSSENGKGDVSLARPGIVLGIADVFMLQTEVEQFHAYMEKEGREWPGQDLPDKYPPGVPQECFKNASQLMLYNPELSYCEGIAYSDKLGGLGFLHGWCVDREGNVVDNTWDNPADCKYFGVKYDRAEYTEHLMRTEMYGIFGGRYDVAKQVLENGGIANAGS